MTKDAFDNALYSVNTRVRVYGGVLEYAVKGVDFGRGMIFIQRAGDPEPTWWHYGLFEFVNPEAHDRG